MPYNQINRAQMRALVRNQLGQASQVFWRDDELNGIIQECLRMFNMLTGFWKGRTTVTTTITGGIPDVWYQLPGTVFSNMRVSWQGFPLSPTGAYSLDFGRPQWESETTSSGGDVPTRPQVWIVGALNLIGIWPADAAGNSAMTIDGFLVTPILTNDGSILDVGDEELTGLLDLAQVIAVFKEGGVEFKDCQELMKGFLKAAGERNSMLMALAAYRKYLGLDKSKYSRPYKLEAERAGVR